MYFLDELKDFKLYKRSVVIPFVESNKRKGSFIYLMTPNTDSTISVLNHKLLTPRYFESLYIERDAVLFIGEDNSIKTESSDMPVLSLCAQGTGYINENCLRINAGIESNFFVNLQEDAKYNHKIKKLLWNDRIKNIKELNTLYEQIKSKVPYIKRTYYDIDKYKGLNLFIDLSYYLTLFSKNNVYKLENGLKLYDEFISRILTNGAYTTANSKKNTLIIDYFGWKKATNCTTLEEVLNWKKNINPLSLIFYSMKRGISTFKNLFNEPTTILILGKDGYFKLNTSDITPDNFNLFRVLINRLDRNEIDEEDITSSSKDSSKVITMQTIEQIEKATGISIDNIMAPKKLVGDDGIEVIPISKKREVAKASVKKIDRGVNKKKEKEILQQVIEKDKTDLVKAVSDKAETSNSADDIINNIKTDDYINNILEKIATEDKSVSKVSAARESRIKELSNNFLRKSINKKTIKDMIEASEQAVPIPESPINIDSINEEWKHMKFNNFEKSYDPEDDIMAILFFLGTLSHPVSVIDVQVEDTTTSEDYIKTYFVECENEKGKRFKLVFDVPKVKQNRFMKLRGNDKILNGQLVLLPCVKTDDDTVQLVSNYNKIFIRRYGTNTGKSCPAVDKLIKALTKYEGKDIKISWGDSSRICAKYKLPFDYVDLSTAIMKIETSNYIIYFNQDEIRSTYNIPDKDIIEHDLQGSFPLMYDKKDKTIIWYHPENEINIAEKVINALSKDTNFTYELVQQQSSSTKYCYAMTSILNTRIPVVVVLGYSFGLSSIIKAVEGTTLSEKAPHKKDFNIGSIKFKDGYLIFNNYGPSAMLFNGLKDCPTEDYSISEMDDKGMWLDFLDEFGGRIKADGLENFADLFVDPKTKTICDLYKLPNNYFDMLLYSTVLLCDNIYNRHTDLTGNRFRENEIIAGYVYSCLATSYGAYATAFKRKQTATMTIKRSAVIDAILVDPTCSDLSKETPLLEKETSSAVSFKGLSGMNSDRSYSLDKRTYDDTMVNKVALSTGFAENVGITRQTTIDMEVKDNLGTLGGTADTNDMSITKTFSITEAMTPMSTTRDDPFRSAMNFVQSYKHTMRTAISHPLLISNGADEALPYLTSDTFAWKAKGKGKVVEKTDEYMVIQYDNPDLQSEFVDLREKVEKNSDGGFFMSIQLETDLKKDAIVKEGEIIAYDRHAYSNIVGATDNIAATPGVLTKIAVPVTYEGYEDSTIVTDYLSRIMESEIIVKEEKVLEKNTNVYFLVKKGTLVQEGDPLLIYQHAYDDKDVNILLKNLTNDEIGEDEISELGRKVVKSRYTGIVQDVKVLRTIDTDEMSDSLKKIVNDYESDVRKYKKVMKKYNTADAEAFDADYKLPPTGVLKNCPEGVKVFIWVKYFDQMSVGDKIVNWAALKGVIRNIPTKGLEPYSEYRPNEEISSMFSIDSINARMVGSILIVGAINKGLIELDRQVKEIMGIPWKTIREYDEENLKSINESAEVIQEEKYWDILRDKADRGYKPKGHKSLSQFTRKPLTKNLIKKFKGQGKLIGNMRDENPKYPEDTCVVWVDGDKYVGAITYDTFYDKDGHKWISGLDVAYDYKGYGLGKQILEYAIKDGVNALSVQYDNEIALKLYKSLGFKIDTRSKKAFDKTKSASYDMFLNNKY